MTIVGVLALALLAIYYSDRSRARTNRNWTIISCVLICTLLVSASATPGNAATGPDIALENLDGAPFADRLIFNRIDNYGGATHRRVTLRIRNVGDSALSISSLPISGPWQLDPAIPLPTSIPTNNYLDVTVRFDATSGDVHNGTLTINSNDHDEAGVVVQLSGFWQSLPENDQEPGIGQIIRVFGYTTELVSAGQRLNRQGLVDAVGEEVLSPYWRRADTSKPVTIRQLSAFHSCCDPATAATVRWHAKGSSSTTTLFKHAVVDGQSLLPRKGDANGEPAGPAIATFTPGSTFGFNVDGEWSDPTLNNQSEDQNNGCSGACGHHVRFWPARDRQGALIPNTYIMAGDYNGINYDYNDNVYLISNVTPETQPAQFVPRQVLYRLDVGGARNYIDSNGNEWRPDTGYFSPPTAPSEPGNLPADVELTRDDVLFGTYRGNVGNVPLNQRVLSYTLPVNNVTQVNMRLFFSERYSGNNATGKRVFDIEAEGQLIRDNFDIYANAGGVNRATLLTFNNLAVRDGQLNLTFRAVADYPSIAGIEVYCSGPCSPTQTLPRRGWMPIATR